MKTKTLFQLSALFILTISCKSYFANYYMKSMGVFDNKIKLEKLTNNKKEIVLFGMHHLGKEEFYTDVKNKVDSLSKENYFFYLEGINSQFTGKTNVTKEDSVKIIDLAYKFRKITGNPLISKKLNSDYISYFEEHGIKIKEKLIMQPKYNELGVIEKNSNNTDLTLEQLLENYETKYGIVVLDSCDYETKFYEKSTCKIKPDPKIYDDMMMTDRNNNVISHILKEEKSKIAIIYGKGHFKGIKDSLQKLGYKIID